MSTFAVVNDAVLVAAIDRCHQRLAYIAPGVTADVVAAIGRLFERPNPPAVTLILDVDPEVYRLGDGTIEGIQRLRALAERYQVGIRSQPGLRLGVLASDDDLLVYAPTPLLVEAAAIEVGRIETGGVSDLACLRASADPPDHQWRAARHARPARLTGNLMLPSILASEIRESTRRFLVSAYEASDAFFHGVMQRFVERDQSVDKGPYLQVGLPFRGGVEGKKFFPGFELEHPGFAHQEAAWRRLASNREAANTLVATGTGSGKTECFLYPVLDHCRRAREAGQVQGIKALVIYPMNALATDQAGRFAKVIASTPAFKDLRVGLYVGGAGKRGGELQMTPTSVITDRDALRKAPPDVLLTNYKMLDYLLVRPKDRKLWEHNGPDVLRYVVVDELHTFDGAQGTDLSLLLRRLRARLGTPARHLICVGTSATLGDGDTQPLRDYARQIFASDFPEESVVTESRDSVAEFLGDEPIIHVLDGRHDLAERLEASAYRSPEAAIAAWFPLFFPGESVPANVGDLAWRMHLGRLLKQHLLLHNLLRLLKGGVGEWATLQMQMAGPLPEVARPHAGKVLDALVALLAWARDPRDPNEPDRPLTTIRVQLWMRELRRLVGSVRAEPANVALYSAADLKATAERLHLPLVQCSECRTTGWLARRPANATQLDRELETIYNAWFRAAPDVARLYPRAGLESPQCEARGIHLCGQCAGVQDASGSCVLCGHDELVAVWEMLEQGQSDRDGVVFNWHEKRCPACSARDRLLLVGARNATLGAQVIEQGWATPYNDDKKLIAFSDSVQDAAHRAGFFGSRTYLNNVRMAMTRVLSAQARPVTGWSNFLSALPTWWRDPSRMSPEMFVTEFIGPNMLWQHDWDRLRATGRLPEGSRLLERVAKRLAWQAVAEFTYLSCRGRTLDRLGVATLAPPADALDAIAARLVHELAEQFGLRNLTVQSVLQWLWGFVIRLRQRGAVTHAEMESYFREGGLFAFARGGRELWLPGMTQFGPHPVFLTQGNHRDADRLVQTRGRTWYQEWLSATLGRAQLLPQRGDADIHGLAIKLLLADGLLVAADGAPGRALALNAERLLLDTRVVHLRSERGRRALSVPAELAERLHGMPCLDAMQETYAHSEAPGGSGAWIARRFRDGDIRRVISAEHTGLLERDEREALEIRFKTPLDHARPWYENLLSATPTLEMGVDIGSLSSVLLCSVPPSQASFLQRVGRAGRRDGNAMVVTLADGASPHDLYFYEQPLEMMAGQVSPPGVFLQAAEVLRRQLVAFCIDSWVGSGIPDTAFPDKTSAALDAIDKNDTGRFPYNLLTFIQQDEASLLDRFLSMMGADLHPRVEARLRDYMFGNGDLDGLRLRLLKTLEELSRERSAHRRRAEEGRKRIATLNAQPQDEATKALIGELTRERDKALELAREIGGRELLGTLTDAGVIPNYAFPEAGIELKSIVWRRRGEGEEGNGAYVTLPTERYERPASSALSEFAPESRFYANRRRVEIDQINMQLAQAEPWRLCPSCHHVENLELSGDAYPACPRCGDAMWANVSQKRTLLRFKQAMANADDAKSRIDDSADDREPRFFVRQLLVDFEPADVEIAWKLESEEVAFGFEFIRKATFRDINFGESGKSGENFRVADRDSTRPGFKLCKHCGKVQKPPRRMANGQHAPVRNHARDCVADGRDDPADIIDCLYLYREFSSEALRILVPYTRSGLDEVVLQSFMAALQLGLKKRFGGKVDHLRITPQEEPGVDGSPRRQYVLLYDSVPGGTGYLHQLLSEEAQTLSEVLEQAHAAIHGCACQADPDKDGCYRCVYQYRQGRAMAQVSRRTAANVLGELVGALGKLERVASISQIFINPHFDSVLESRFVESLRRLGGAKDKQGKSVLPPVRVMQEVVQGKSGYLLEVGGERYWMRPQVDLGSEQGVAVASRPDFLLLPARSNSTRRPIAVFADGWAYHKGCLREDARKRSALVASRRYWVWSVTWEDVEAALAGEVESGLDIQADQARLPPDHPLIAQAAAALGVPAQARNGNAVAALLSWLAMPASETSDEGRERLEREAAMLTARLIVAPGTAEQTAAAQALQEVATALPDGCRDAPAGFATAWSRDVAGATTVCYAWPRTFLQRSFADGYGAVRLCPDRAGSADELKLAWRSWLALYNRLQVLPSTYLLEASGMLHGDYGLLVPAAGAGDAAQPANGDPWPDVMGAALSELQPGLAALRDAGAPAPDHVGFELAAPSGEVMAEAELAWEGARVVVLAEHQIDLRGPWEAEGWMVIDARQPEWPLRVLEQTKE
ncbi:MAG: DEAD/DEAH box helicase [Rhodanobacteraceae bacterium]|jgi:DEAD/DEAH box helicase domain-containing protein|nr:DEAD/DEAH box helicase [Rhodanobacteraceae bacterium]